MEYTKQILNAFFNTLKQDNNFPLWYKHQLNGRGLTPSRIQYIESYFVIYDNDINRTPIRKYVNGYYIMVEILYKHYLKVCEEFLRYFNVLDEILIKTKCNSIAEIIKNQTFDCYQMFKTPIHKYQMLMFLEFIPLTVKDRVVLKELWDDYINKRFYYQIKL